MGTVFRLRLDRIKSVRKGRRFFYPETFSLRDFIKRLWAIEVSEPIYVKVRFMNQVNVVNKAKQPLKRRCSPCKLTIEEDGSLLFEGTVVGIEAFRSWVRGFGSSVEVIEPAKTREDMIQTALHTFFGTAETEQIDTAVPKL